VGRLVQGDDRHRQARHAEIVCGVPRKRQARPGRAGLAGAASGAQRSGTSCTVSRSTRDWL
jgi:hypothetical protein